MFRYPRVWMIPSAPTPFRRPHPGGMLAGRGDGELPAWPPGPAGRRCRGPRSGCEPCAHLSFAMRPRRGSWVKGGACRGRTPAPIDRPDASLENRHLFLGGPPLPSVPPRQAVSIKSTFDLDFCLNPGCIKPKDVPTPSHSVAWDEKLIAEVAEGRGDL